MGDTLRSIAEKWHKWAEECRARAEDIKLAGLILTREETLDDCAAELEALLAKYERVDLVKKWKQVANDMRVAATRERAYAERFYDERAEHLRNARDFDDTANLYDACTDELETWLAVNLERIKAQAQLEEAKWWSSKDRPNGPRTLYPNEKGHLTALEAQAKEKPTKPDAQGGFLHKLTKEEVKNCAENPDYEEEP